MFINPAYAGNQGSIFCSRARPAAMGWNGWRPATQTVSIHGPFYDNTVGVGLSILNESIGVSRETSYMGTFAYSIKANEKGRLSFGLSVGVNTEQQKLADVVTQTPGDIQFEKNTPILTMPNASFGLYYLQKSFTWDFLFPK